ncbi:MAG: hypothetical protein ACI8Z7_000577 [Candidatus Nanohaloarchaea archaeon]|jgi:hypothetical protein
MNPSSYGRLGTEAINKFRGNDSHSLDSDEIENEEIEDEEIKENNTDFLNV